MTNLTNIDTLVNVTGITQLASNLNNEVGGLIGISIHLMIVGVLFVSLKSRNFETSDAFISTAFVAFVISIFLRTMSLIPDIYFYANIALLGVAGAILIISRS